WRSLPAAVGPVGAAAGAGLVVGALVGLPVLALVAAGVVWLARQARGVRAVPAVNELGEAVATWCETVRQELDAGQPLRAAVAASCQLPPPPLAAPLTALARRLEAQEALPVALAAFHREAGHPAVGQVVAALTLAYRHGAGELGRLMASQVETTRHRVAVVRDLHAGRARHRRAMALLLGLFALTTAGLLAAWPALLTPYRTPLGQLALAADLALVGTAVRALLRRSRPPTVPDFFGRDAR
ncbi:type II secretion system F family protein, partial [Frankia nepalensis]